MLPPAMQVKLGVDPGCQQRLVVVGRLVDGYQKIELVEFGGQLDFVRGAARSAGGKPIIALPSTARRGTLSRIAGTLDAGAGVVTTRAHVHYVVTEYGVANLFGKSLRRRAEELLERLVESLRADDAVALAEAFLDRMYGAAESSAFIVHGVGSGALRQAIHEHLSRDATYVEGFRPATQDEGGPQVTVVSLK